MEQPGLQQPEPQQPVLNLKKKKQSTIFDHNFTRNAPKDLVQQQAAKADDESRAQQAKENAQRAAAAAAAKSGKRGPGRPHKARRTAGDDTTVARSRKQYQNWWSPALIEPILEAVRRHGGCYATAVQELKRRFPKVYSGLHANTVSRWYEPHSNQQQLTESAQRMRRLAGKWAKPAGSGRKSVLTGHDDVKQQILDTLTALRNSGLGVSPGAARALMIGVLEEKLPQMQVGTAFLCSYSWVRRFLERELRWVIR